MRGMTVGLALGLVGCGADDPEMWGLLHGHLSVGTDSLTGFLVWELYEPEWKRKRSSELHRCARVLAVDGVLLTGEGPSGCATCTEVYALAVDDVDQDCPGSEGSAPGLASLTHLAVAPLQAGDSQVGAHGAQGRSVFHSWDGAVLEHAGVVWDEGYGAGEPPADEGAWTPGRRYTLWPAEVWRLRADALADRAVADTGSLR
jgi:hypothetical protein